MTLSPSGVASVCLGEDLAFTCSTDKDFLEWNVTIVTGQTVSRTRLISVGVSIIPLMINMKLFNISFTNVLGGSSVSLESVLFVTNVTADLNGTMVNCTEVGTSLADTSSSIATVHVIRTGDISTFLNTLAKKGCIIILRIVHAFKHA